MRNKGKKGKTSITSKLLNVMIAATLAFQPVFNSTGLFAITAKAEGEEPELVPATMRETNPVEQPSEDPVVTPDPTEQPVLEEPAPETPEEPAPETPASPDPETPTEPEPGTPENPAPETPANPDPETPTEPEPETPENPEPGNPANPDPAKPDLEGVMEIKVEQPARNSNTFKFTIKVVKDGVYSYQYLVNNSKDSADWSTVTETEILPDGEKTEKDIIVENKENGTYYAHLRYWLGEDPYTEGTTTKELTSDEVVVDVDKEAPVLTVNGGEDIKFNKEEGTFDITAEDKNIIKSLSLKVFKTAESTEELLPVLENQEIESKEAKSFTWTVSSEDLSGLEDGTYVLKVRAVDEFNNISDYTVSANLTIDTVVPEIVKVTPELTEQKDTEDKQHAEAKLTVEFNEAVKDIKVNPDYSEAEDVEITVENEGNTYTYTYKFLGTENTVEDYTISSISFADLLGNAGEVYNVENCTVTVDRAAPVLKSVESRSEKYNEIYTFVLEDVSEIDRDNVKVYFPRIIMDDTVYEKYDESYELNEETGLYTYTFKIRVSPYVSGHLRIDGQDIFGNKFTEELAEVLLESDKPVVTLVEESSTEIGKLLNKQTIVLKVSDKYDERKSSGLQSWTWQLFDQNGNPVNNLTEKKTYRKHDNVTEAEIKISLDAFNNKFGAPLDGEYTLKVFAKDYRENENEPFEIKVNLSDAIPTVTISPEPEYDEDGKPSLHINGKQVFTLKFNAGEGSNGSKPELENIAYLFKGIDGELGDDFKNEEFAEGEDKTVKEITVSMDADEFKYLKTGELRVALNALNTAGNSMEEEVYKYFYDNTPPSAEITYTDPSRVEKATDTTAETYFYGIGADSKINIEIDEPHLKTVLITVHAETAEGSEDIEFSEITDNKFEYVMEEDGIYTVSIDAEDYAGNRLGKVVEAGEECKTDETQAAYDGKIVLVKDTKAPEVVIAYSDAIDDYLDAEKALYYGSNNKAADVTFTFTDVHPGTYDLNKDVVFLYRNDKLIWNDDADHKVSYKPLTFDDGEYSYDVLGSEEDDRAGTTDRAGNKAIVKEQINGGEAGKVVVEKIIVDRTAPVAKITFNAPHATADNRDYYGAAEKEITASFEITDVHFDYDKLKYGYNSTVINAETTYDQATVDWKDPDQKFSEEDADEKGTTLKKTLSLTDDGVYRVMIKGTDKANNSIVVTSESKDMNVSNGGFQSVLKVLDKVISSEATIQNPNGFEYFKVNSAGIVTPENPNVYRAEKSALISMYAVGEKSPYKMNYEIHSSILDKNITDKQNQFGFTNMSKELSEDQVFNIVTVVIEDRAGNIATIGEQTNIYLDTSMPSSDRSKPVASVKTSSAITARNADGRDLFGADVTLDLSVFDPNASAENPTSSGLKNVYYEVKADGVTVQSNTEADGNINNPKQYDWNRRITVTNDTNDIELILYAYDNAGNISNTITYKFAIDKTAPEITITYDNNDAQHEKYFKATRIATVRIEDRNIDVSKIHITTQGTQSGWSAPTANGSGVGNNDVRTCTITYATDGDYTLEVTGADAVDHTANVHYEGVAPRDFTIDKTAPVITVTFNNNDVRNGKYYKEARIATVSINEHNFLANEVNIATQQNIQRGTTASPAPSGFSNNGDIHNATMNYNQDGNFSFTVDYTDMAGNPAQTVNISEFVIDQTAPTVKFDEATVRENLATAGDIAPSAIFDDTNFSGDLVNFILTGARTNEHDVIFAKNFNQFGGTITYNNFAVVKENDDVYTLVATIEDLAGNKADTEIHFSVNRFGSTFDLNDDADTMALVSGYYAQQPGSVFVREINVNSLTEHSVTVNRDGTNILLKEGTDYKLTEMNWNGGKQYVYEIFASVFEKEGSYSITVQSVDTAGNINTNSSVHRNEGITDFPVRFAVDRTLPVNNITELAADRLNRISAASKEFEADITDNMALSKIVITIDGNEVFNKDGKALADYLKSNNSKVYFTADASGSPQTISIKSYDGAGNESETTEYRVLVSDNALVQYYYNTPLFVGSLGGLAAVIFGILIAAKRKKENEEETAE
ncbi:MAG: Ig-like domain-containing protein [Erysipelotrichaceae bacterium]|nr:Ig-like domain-containing protein [Erysipelotrichaceae bacterium]